MRTKGLATFVVLLLQAPLAALADSAGQVADTFVGNFSGVPHLRESAAVFAGQLYFPGQDSNNNIELWRYDGIDPPVLAADINPSGGSSPVQLTTFDDRLCFLA